MTGAVWPSLLVSGLFAVHPLHVESVAWAAERKDVLSTFFFLWTLFAYARYSENKTLGRYLVVAGLFVLGLMSKPMLVTLPLVLLLIDVWPLRRTASESFLALAIGKTPLLVMSAVSSLITIYAQRSGGALVSLESLAFERRLENASVALTTYIGRMFWPSGLSALYSYPADIPIWQWLASLGAISAVSILVYRQRSQRPYLAVGWLWYLITVVPVLGVVQVGSQPTADRYTYIPLLGLFVMIAWGSEEIAKASSFGRRITSASTIGMLLLLALATRSQVGYWSDGTSLWTHAIAVTPDNALAHYHLGDALARSGQGAPAIDHYRQALLLRPDFSEAHDNLGVRLEELGRVDEAVREFEAAILANPSNAQAHSNLGAAQARRGDFEAAIKNFRITAQLKPELVSAYTNLGGALAETGSVEEAKRAFESALAIDINSAEAHNGLGLLSSRRGLANEAIDHFKAAVRADPNVPAIHINLCRVLAAEKRDDEAMTECEAAVTLRPNVADYRYGLAMLMLRAKRTPAAIEQLRIVVKLDPGNSAARRILDAVSRPAP